MSTAADNFLARVTGASAGLSFAYRQFLDTLTTKGLFNSDGTSSFFDWLHVYSSQDSATALLNLVSSSFNGTLHGCTFTTNVGFTGVDSSTTNYIDTGFDPTMGTPKYTQNSAHISIWSNTSAASTAGGGDAIGSFNSGFTEDVQIICRYSDGNAYWRVNDGGSGGIANADGKGFYLGNRSGASAQQGYKNAIDQGVVAVASVTPTNAPFFVLATNRQSIPGPGNGAGIQARMASAGASLTSTQVTDFYNALVAFFALADAGFPSGAPEQRRRLPFRGPRRGPLARRGFLETPTTPVPDPPVFQTEQRRRRPGGWSPRRGPLTGRSYVEIGQPPTAAVGINASAALVQADATLSAAATVTVGASATLTQANATLSAAATLAIAANASLTQANATLAATAGVKVGASAALTQADATLSAAATLPIGASAALTQANATLVAAATLPIAGNAGLTQANATLTATAVAAIAASAGLTQADATLAATAQTLATINADAALVQADSTLSADASVADAPVVVPPVLGGISGSGAGRRVSARYRPITLRAKRLKKKLETLEELLADLRLEADTPWVAAFPEVAPPIREYVAEARQLVAEINAARAQAQAAAEDRAYAEMAAQAKALQQELEDEEELIAATLILLH